MFHVEHHFLVEIVPWATDLFHVEHSAVTCEGGEANLFHVELTLQPHSVMRRNDIPRGTVGRVNFNA
jgi:hypothetical protein